MHVINGQCQNLTPEMMRWVSLTRLISGVSRTKAALPWTCFRKLSEYSTWRTAGSGRYSRGHAVSICRGFQTWSYHTVGVSIHSTKGVAKKGNTQLLTEWAGALLGFETHELAGRFFSIKSVQITPQSSVRGCQGNKMDWSSFNNRRG